MTEPILVLADIIQNQLTLSPGQVMTAYQKYNIPTEGLFIVLSYAGPSRIIATNDVFVDANGVVVATPYSPFSGAPLPSPVGGLTEVQSVTMLYEVQVDMMAFNNDDGTNDARSQKEQVVMAMSSAYSEQSQEANAMQISRDTGPIIDTSFLEGVEYLQRYTTKVRITAATAKSQVAQYFDVFARPQMVVNQ